ncbi:hypothetical protein [Bifidobacterium felsineum]|uniref:hypothetical protein n=1 Tax=Bifidobacterium felsineum TaxID=2045440 RepID=UPI001BDCA048|nr:hypothetical protein [Bifidobacterium felsineum]MBT1164563.1 hypothetical protein [Bifidobacterium felsineum]
MLHVPDVFLDELAERRLFPKPDSDGAYRILDVEAALRALPWLKRLGVPLSEGELARVADGLEPPVHAGFTWGDRRYCRLWEALAAAWKVDPIEVA